VLLRMSEPENRIPMGTIDFRYKSRWKSVGSLGAKGGDLQSYPRCLDRPLDGLWLEVSVYRSPSHQ
jgi:hypothetical protein